MLQRIAVHLAGGGEDESRALLSRQAERVQGAQAADLQRLDGQLEVVDGRGRGCQVQDQIHIARHMDESRQVTLGEPESRPADEVGDVAR
jgi:hypothetical protein